MGGSTHTSSTVKTTVVPASSCVSTTPTSTTRTTTKASRSSNTSPTTNTNKSKHSTGKSVWRSGTVSCTEPFQPVFTRFVPPYEHTTTTSFVDCEIINL